MNGQRVIAIVGKDLKKTVREPAMLFLIVLFPLMLTLVFGISMGGVGGDTTQTFVLGVVNHDSGPSASWSTRFIENLTANPMLDIQSYADDNSAAEALSQGKMAALVTIPDNFDESCASFQEHPTNESLWVRATLNVSVDKGSMIATQAIPPLIQQALVATLVGQQSNVSIPVSLGTASLVQAERRSVFFYMVPGVFAYGTIFIIMEVGQSFTVEREEGLLRRMNTTPLTSSEFMTAQVLSNMVIAIIQVIVVFATAFAIGYRPESDASGIAMAFLIVSVFSLCCVGLGLICATVAKSTGAATGLAFVFIMPMMFFGTFVSAAASSPISTEIGRFMPSQYVTDAITSLFSRGAPVTSQSVVVDLAVVLVFSVVVLIAGIVLFRKYGNR